MKYYFAINNRPSSHILIKFHQQKWSVADEVFENKNVMLCYEKIKELS